MYIGERGSGLMYEMNKEAAYNDLSGGSSLKLSTPGRGKLHATLSAQPVSIHALDEGNFSISVGLRHQGPCHNKHLLRASSGTHKAERVRHCFLEFPLRLILRSQPTHIHVSSYIPGTAHGEYHELSV